MSSDGIFSKIDDILSNHKKLNNPSSNRCAVNLKMNLGTLEQNPSGLRSNCLAKII